MHVLRTEENFYGCITREESDLQQGMCCIDNSFQDLETKIESIRFTSRALYHIPAPISFPVPRRRDGTPHIVVYGLVTPVDPI